jgi:bifunctional non-homologous end joining protein LigD
VFFAFDLLHLNSQDLRRTPLIERRAALCKLIEPDPRSPIQFSDHVDSDGARFFKAAAELGLEGIVSKLAASLYRGGPSRSWLKIKNMSRASSSWSAPTEMSIGFPGRCWRRIVMASLSSPAPPS